MTFNRPAESIMLCYKQIKILIYSLPVTFCGIAGAQEASPLNNMQNSAGSSAVINTQSSAADLSQSVPNVFAPGLSNVPETCAKTTSGALGLPGLGIGIGVSRVEKECSRRMYARLMGQLGDTEAAKSVLCNNDEVREAYRSVGRPCASNKQP